MSIKLKRELPDIDDGPEVYETPDSEPNKEPENQTVEKFEVSEDLYRAPIDASKSFEKFQNSQNLPFRNPFSAVPPEGFETVPAETVQQKLRRLQYEVQELEKEIESSSSTTVVEKQKDLTSNEMMGSIKKLESDLKKMEGHASYRSMNKAAIDNLNKQVESLPKLSDPKKLPSSDSLTYEIFYRPDGSSVSLPDAERRISALEESVGIQYLLDNPKTAQGLLRTMNSLEQKVNSINPIQIEFISKKIKAIMGDIDKIIEAKINTPSTEIESQVTKIFTLMEKWDQTSDSLSLIVGRLRDLKQIHESSATIVDSVTQISDEQKGLSESLSTTQATLEKVEKNFSENMKTIDKNIQNIQTRLDTLLKRLEQ